MNAHPPGWVFFVLIIFYLCLSLIDLGMPMNPRLVLFANGLLPDLQAARHLVHPDDVIIAVNGGTRHVLDLGLVPSVIIGDLDSFDPEVRRQVQRLDVHRIEYPRDKNETDLELALHYAVGQGFDRIIILAALGGRLDQTLANLSLLTDPDLADLDIRLDDGIEEVILVRNSCQIEGTPGDIVSLIPWGGSVSGVTVSGLRWPLRGETLIPHRTRAISNEMRVATARVSIQAGFLLAIHRRLSQLSVP